MSISYTPWAIAQPCFIGFTDLVGETHDAREAARVLQARHLATDQVIKKYLELKKDPSYAGLTDKFVIETARDLVRASLGSREAERYFDRAVADVRRGLAAAQLPYSAPPAEAGVAERGKPIVDRAVDVFNDAVANLVPKRANGETTVFEDLMLIRLAYRNLAAKGTDTANAVHIQEHLRVLSDPAVRAALKESGLSELALVRNVMLHDLGKEYDQLPADYRSFLEEAFPLPNPPGGPDPRYLHRVIMSHEFGSMVMTEQLAREAGISEDKIPRLKALMAHHNAGYDPDLKGFHFWVQSYAWGAFAAGLRAKGVVIPEKYSAVPSMKEGGSAETIVLTAIDRATSLTLASQEKFAPVWINAGKWTNAGLAGEFRANAENVMTEVENVLNKLDGRAKNITAPIMKAFIVDLSRLQALAAEIPKMAKGEGVYSDRPPTTDKQLQNGVIYRTRDGRWYRVDNDGAIYTSSFGQPWALDVLGSPGVGQKGNPAATLFRNVIFPDQAYTPQALQSPRILQSFPDLSQ